MTSDTDTRTYVWDLALRCFHWLLVVSFISAYFSEGEWMGLHTWAGYLIVLLLGFRLIWGLVGPVHARFSDFVRTPATVLRYTFDVVQGQAQRYIGHNPAGGAMILALLAMLLLTTLSGMALYGADAWRGPLVFLMQGLSDEGIEVLEEVHEIAANTTVVLVVVHILGVIWESRLHRENLVRAMVTGWKRR